MLVTGWILFLSATVGNAALVMYVVNWMHGIPIPHRIQGKLKWLLMSLTVVGMAYFWWVSSFPLEELLALTALGPLPVAYTGLCAITGMVLPSIVLVQHFARRPVPALLSNHNHVVDVSAKLGYRPEGRGQYRLLTRLPGNESLLVDLSEKVLTLPRLPAALDGLTILHLTDFHLCGVPDKAYHKKVMDLCNEREPEIVAFTGDLVDSHWHHCWIVPVLGRLRYKVAAYAILGNHDHWYDARLIQRRLRRIGFRVLGNSWEELIVRGQRIAVIGNEAPWIKPVPDLTACPEDLFRLCLSHTPDNIYWARQHALDLVLAGHVHGGQIQFPLLGPIHIPSRYGRRFVGGAFEEGPTVMHVSRGLGGQEPLRYNCKPEAALLTLRRREA